MPQQQELIRYLGVDDRAWHNGESYGAILVDLAEGRVVGAPPGQSEDSLTLLISHHPTIEIIARDPGAVHNEVDSSQTPPEAQGADPSYLPLNLSGAEKQSCETCSCDLLPSHPSLPVLAMEPLPAPECDSRADCAVDVPNHNPASGHWGALRTVVEAPGAESLEEGDRRRPQY